MSWQVPEAPSSAPAYAGITVEESARLFMGRVHRWMIAGLTLSAATAWFVASSPGILSAVAPLFPVIIIGKLVLVLAFGWLAPRVSAVVAATMFLLYSFSTGVVFSLLFIAYELGSIFHAFAITAGAFAALSVYGTVTKRDLSAWATFLFMGLIGVLIAGVVQMFVRSEGLSFVWSCACVVVFAGLTAYDTQKLRRFHADSGYASKGSLAISGALMLYLDFVNLFLAILRLMGRRR